MSTWAHLHLPRLQSGETPDVISVKIPGQHIEYASWVSLRDAEFRVSEPGRQRCIREGVRNVHAWVVGTEILRVGSNWRYNQAPCPVGYRQAVYDPWKGGIRGQRDADPGPARRPRDHGWQEGVLRMTDQEFAAWLRSLPREQSEEESARLEHEHDLARGEYVNPHLTPHHYGEAAH